MVDAVAKGTFAPPIGRVFQIGEIVEAHRVMETNAAGGEIVVMT